MILDVEEAAAEDNATGGDEEPMEEEEDLEEVAGEDAPEDPAESSTTAGGGLDDRDDDNDEGKGEGGSTAGPTEDQSSAAEVAPVVPAAPPAAVVSRRGRGARSGAAEPLLDAVTQASFLQASALVSSFYPAVASLLTATPKPGSGSSGSTAAGGSGTGTAGGAGGANGAATSPDEATLAQLLQSVESVASKMAADRPPWLHWNRSDAAPQLKADPRRLQLTGPLRGYRMARASLGVSSGLWYYECVVLPGPTAQEILAQLPSQARLGPGLERRLQDQLREEHADESENPGGATTDPSQGGPPAHKRQRRGTPVGGHVRLGWSMRTGELQAPVGYDKWSFGFRDVQGSIVHQSQRQDAWGGEGDFGEGDVIGCGICLDADIGPHIRFFVNGECRGNFVISKGKRVGGVAFEIEPGTYYPAVSLYMGGAVRANFGPHWIYPPRKLPAGFPKFQPLSNAVPPPPQVRAPSDAGSSAASAAAACEKALKALRKPEHQKVVRSALEAESRVQCEAYDKYHRAQLEFVRSERAERGLSTTDLQAALEALSSREPSPSPA